MVAKLLNNLSYQLCRTNPTDHRQLADNDIGGFHDHATLAIPKPTADKENAHKTKAGKTDKPLLTSLSRKGER